MSIPREIKMRKAPSSSPSVCVLALVLLILVRCTNLPLGPLNRTACGSGGRKAEARERRQALKQIKSLGIVICSPDLRYDECFGELLETRLSPTFVRVPHAYARYVLFVYPRWHVRKRSREVVSAGPPTGSLFRHRWSGSAHLPWTVSRWHLSFKAKCFVVDVDKAEVLYSFTSKWKKVERPNPFLGWPTREEYVRKGLAELATKIATTLHKCRWSD